MCLPPAQRRMATPEQNGEEYHEEGMGAQVGCNREIGIKSWSPHLLLHPRQIGRLPPDDGQQSLAQLVPPWWESSLVCNSTEHMSASINDSDETERPSSADSGGHLISCAGRVAEKTKASRHTVIQASQPRVGHISRNRDCYRW